MDVHTFFAFVAIAIAVARYATYFHTIYLGATKPHAFTWLLSGVVTGIGTLAQWHLHGGPSVWGLAFVSGSCLFIGALSFFVGERSRTASDWAALIVGLSAIPVWHMTSNPAAALFLTMATDVIAYWPTVRKSWNKPETEPPISGFMAGLRYFFIGLAVPDPGWRNVMYPFFLMAVDWAFALYIFIRRLQLGRPLHEYA